MSSFLQASMHTSLSKMPEPRGHRLLPAFSKVKLSPIKCELKSLLLDEKKEYHQVSNESVKALHEFPVGQSFLLQGRVCFAIEPSESHSLPPFCGAGLLQARARV